MERRGEEEREREREREREIKGMRIASPLLCFINGIDVTGS